MLATELERMIGERLQPNEMILGWTEVRRGEIVVELIDKELHRVCQASTKRFRRGAGCGRTLEFQEQEGDWVFTGEGGWIS
jgi:hypothetical protein